MRSLSARADSAGRTRAAGQRNAHALLHETDRPVVDPERAGPPSGRPGARPRASGPPHLPSAGRWLRRFAGCPARLSTTRSAKLTGMSPSCTPTTPRRASRCAVLRRGADGQPAARGELLDELQSEDGLGPDVELDLLEGPPAEAVARAAMGSADADEIIVGSRGLGRFRGAFGSVSHALLHEADRPVVVVPQPTMA